MILHYQLSPIFQSLCLSGSFPCNYSEVMDIVKAIAAHEGKPDYVSYQLFLLCPVLLCDSQALKSGSVWSGTKVPGVGSVSGTPTPAGVKTKKQQETKKKKNGACIQWNTTGSCRASSSGRECRFDHTCNILTRAGPNAECGQQHPAKEHQF